jgi:carboxylesterase
MIEISETFDVAAPPGEVYAVLSDPAAVAECVSGAALGERHEDGTYDGTITVRFSALRVRFSGRVGLELDSRARRGTVNARGRDAQGGTKFQATAAFEVAADGTAGSRVTASGEVVLSGKLASIIEGAAGAVVKRMTQEFVEALSLRCASGPAELAPPDDAPTGDALPGVTPADGNALDAAAPDGAPGTAAAARPRVGVLLLHGFGGSPGGVRAWSEALAAAGAGVSVPRLPGHGTRWRDLDRATAADWYDTASDALTTMRQTYEQVWVMGLSLGATLGLRLAERRPGEVAGVVAVNPSITGVAGAPRMPILARLFRRSFRAVTDDAKKPGVRDIGYDRVPLRALRSLVGLGTQTAAELGGIEAPVLLAVSVEDHVVSPADGERVWTGLTTARRQRIRLADSFHLAPVDNDSAALFAECVAFMRSAALADAP